MRTTNFDVIAAAAPLDRQASVVRDGSGDLYEERVPEQVYRWMAPPPMKPMGKNELKSCGDLIGLRVGRLRVIGCLEGSNPKKGAVWVCRCDCGYYEGRKAKALRNPAANHLCTVCERVERMRAGRYKTTRAADAERLDAIANGSRP